MASIQDYKIPEMQAIKAKYPEYQDMNDIALLNSVVRKYPVYKDIADRVGGELRARLKAGDTVDEEKAPVLSKITRSLMGSSVLEQYNTAAYRLGTIQANPQGKDETSNDYQRRIETKMQERENTIAKGGTLPQLDTLMTLGVGTGLMNAPKLTAKLLASFAALEGGAQITGVNNAIEKIDNPNLKDATQIAKFALFGALSGGVANARFSKKPNSHITNDNIHPDVLTSALKIIDKVVEPTTPELAKNAKVVLVKTVAEATGKSTSEVVKSLKVESIPKFKMVETVDGMQPVPIIEHPISSKIENTKKSGDKSYVKNNYNQILKDLLDSTPNPGLSIEEPGRSANRAEAQRRLVEEHLPSIISEAKRSGKNLQRYLKDNGFTPEHIKLMLAVSGQKPDVVSSSQPVVSPKDQRLNLIKQRAQAPYKVTINTPTGEKEVLMPLTKLMDLKDDIKSGNSNLEILSAVRVEQAPVSNATITPNAGVKISQSPAAKIESYPNPKPTGLSTSVEANAVASKLTQGFGGLSEYESINIPEQAKAASLLVNRDPDLAKKIVFENAEPPQGLKSFSVYTALEAKAIADGDVNTLRDLATRSPLNQESSGAAQTLRLLAERNPESPVSVIKDIKNSREAVAKKRSSVEDLSAKKAKIISEIKEEISKVKASKETWEGFINSIRC